ncbi:MAG TPA: M14 family metallopeptidase [Actinomycetota bacterium]|nr:M14 family metallopeptidase [Actinomycetota bacterium]
MRKLTVVSLALLLLATLAPAARTDTPKLALVRVTVTSPEQASYLMNRFDESHNHSASEIELVLWPGDRLALDELGYDYRVVTEDLVARDRELNEGPHPLQSLPGPDYSDYRRLPDYNREMQEIADANPKIVKMFEMKRLSLEGRPIFGLEIAEDVKSDDGRPVFYMDAVHHAREWPASEFTMIFAHYLVEGYGKNPEITSLLKKTRVILVPVVNVDGFNYSRESVFSAHPALRQQPFELPMQAVGFEGYWRKNRRSFTGITAPVLQVNPDAYGVDPNRNYAYLWGDQQGGSSNNFFDLTYRGAAPFSEPEVANVRDIVVSNNVTGLITNHTVQASVLRAGGGQAPEDKLLSALGQKMADLLKFMNAPTVGYPTTGTTDDWAYNLMSVLGYTIEHGGTGFHCAYDECVGMPTDRTMKAFMVLLNASANPQYHSVITGKVADGPAKLTLWRKVKTPLSPGNPLGKEFVAEKVRITINTNPDGSFEWHVSPSDQPWTKGKKETYQLEINVGGKTKTLEVFFARGEKLDLGTIRL